MKNQFQNVPDIASLVRSLLGTVKSTLAEQEPPHPLATDIPGGTVAFAVGRLHLMADERMRNDLQLTLWPQVRTWFGGPAALVKGDYKIPREIADAVVKANVMPTKAGAEASVLHANEALDMLQMRLEAGYLMAACEALWPSRADALCRSLWHEAGLSAWDSTLTNEKSTLKPLRPAVLRLLARTAVSLDEARFGPLLALARMPLSTVAPQPQAELLGITGTLIAERLVRFEYPEHHANDRYLVWEENGRVCVDLWEPKMRLELDRDVTMGLESARLASRTEALPDVPPLREPAKLKPGIGSVSRLPARTRRRTAQPNAREKGMRPVTRLPTRASSTTAQSQLASKPGSNATINFKMAATALPSVKLLNEWRLSRGKEESYRISYQEETQRVWIFVQGAKPLVEVQNGKVKEFVSVAVRAVPKSKSYFVAVLTEKPAQLRVTFSTGKIFKHRF